MPDEVEAVVLDLDGVIIESEEAWEQARQNFAARYDVTWTHNMNRGIINMGPRQSSDYIRGQLSLPLSAHQILDGVVDELLQLYDRDLPLIDGASDAVRALATRWPLGLASSAARKVVEHVLRAADLQELFQAAVSVEEVAAGKPAPDVYLETCRRLRVKPAASVAIEDTDGGIESAMAAGMSVIAVTGSRYPPSDVNRERCGVCMARLADVRSDTIVAAARGLMP